MRRIRRLNCSNALTYVRTKIHAQKRRSVHPWCEACSSCRTPQSKRFRTTLSGRSGEDDPIFLGVSSAASPAIKEYEPPHCMGARGLPAERFLVLVVSYARATTNPAQRKPRRRRL